MFNNLIKSVENLNPDCNYWFVRTDGGAYFNTFLDNNFIAIGWNNITVQDLKLKDSQIREKIFRVERLDKKIRSDKARASDIINKLQRFKKMKKGDVIVIPSENSRLYSFGTIEDDFIYESRLGENNCQYVKRRKVRWSERSPIPFESLNEVFYAVRRSRHAISDINEYADHVDSVMYNIYKKDEYSHFVINVKTTESINWLNLGQTLLELHALLTLINERLGLNENVFDGQIQIRLESPGSFNLKQKGIALILLATVLGSNGCIEGRKKLAPPDQEKLKSVEREMKVTIDTISNSLRKLNVSL